MMLYTIDRVRFSSIISLSCLNWMYWNYTSCRTITARPPDASIHTVVKITCRALYKRDRSFPGLAHCCMSHTVLAWTQQSISHSVLPLLLSSIGYAPRGLRSAADDRGPNEAKQLNQNAANSLNQLLKSLLSSIRTSLLKLCHNTHCTVLFANSTSSSVLDSSQRVSISSSVV